MYSASTWRVMPAPTFSSSDERLPTTRKSAPKEMTTRNQVDTKMCDAAAPA